MKKKNVLPPTYLLLTIVIQIVIHFVLPILRIIDFPWSLLGLIPLAFGAIINLKADNDFKKNNTTVKPYEESSVLLTNGIFRLSRNPMYLGFVLILSGIAIIVGSLPPFLVTLVFIIVMKKVFIDIEEHMLEKKFGDDWMRYKKNVRRWI